MQVTDLDADVLLAALVLAVPDLILLIDRNGHFRAILGGADSTRYRNPYRIEKLVGSHLADVLPAGVAALCEAAIDTAIDERRTETIHYSLTESEVATAGPAVDPWRGLYWYEARVSPVPTSVNSQSCAVVVVTNITQRVEQQEKLAQLLPIDPLTGVLSRASFIQRYEEYGELNRRHGMPLSLAVLDVDRLDNVNSFCGFETGNRLLAAFARRLKDNVRVTDVLTRIGDDEFALLLPFTRKRGALMTVRRLQEEVRRHPFQCGTHEISTSFTAGIAEIAATQRATGLSVMLREAEAALQTAKQAGRGSVHVTDQDG